MNPDSCIRQAWLTLGDETLLLEDDEAGYYCTELNLGYPEVREVTSNRPDMHGVDDRTQYFGSRAISANIAGRGGTGTMSADQISSVFAHFMLPSTRPRLHYVLERPESPERFVTVRAANYSWPLSGSKSREIQLNWVAADPTMYDPAEQVAESMAGTGGATVDRTYPLVFDRVYQTPGGGVPTPAEIRSPGDVALRPLFRIHGPITTPGIDLEVSTGETVHLWFNPGVRLGTGQWVDVDAANHSAFYDSDPTLPALGDIDWANSRWPVLPVLAEFTTMQLFGDSTSTVTRAEAIWHDGYLS